MENGNATILALAAGLVGYSFGKSPDMSVLVNEKLSALDKNIALMNQKIDLLSNSQLGDVDLSLLHDGMSSIQRELKALTASIKEYLNNKPSSGESNSQTPNIEIMQNALDMLQDVTTNLKSMNEKVDDNGSMIVQVRDHLTSVDHTQSLDSIKSEVESIGRRL